MLELLCPPAAGRACAETAFDGGAMLELFGPCGAWLAASVPKGLNPDAAGIVGGAKELAAPGVPRSVRQRLRKPAKPFAKARLVSSVSFFSLGSCLALSADVDLERKLGNQPPLLLAAAWGCSMMVCGVSVGTVAAASSPGASAPAALSGACGVATSSKLRAPEC